MWPGQGKLSAFWRFFYLDVLIFGVLMDRRGLGFLSLVLTLFVGAALSACQGGGSPAATASAATKSLPPSGPDRMTFSAPLAWGGEARCTGGDCKLILVEHEANKLVLRQFKGRQIAELDRQPLAYHPDSAKWLTDQWVVAAVERGQTLDFFSLNAGRLTAHAQVKVDFAPRDVLVLDSNASGFTLLATPYSGANVSVVKWPVGAKQGNATSVRWCEAPWHPALVERAPNGRGKGVVAACLDDKRLLYVDAKNWVGAPAELARFDVVARQARPTASGKWVYVALELGPKNARVNMDSGEVQYLESRAEGAVSVALLADDLVIWGGSNSLYIQKFDDAGKVLEERYLRTSGFPTEMQLIDLDGDGERDLLILNSAGDKADVYYGPLWDRSLEKL